MEDRSLEYIIGVYEKPYVPGEIRSKETNKKLRDEKKRKDRHLIFDELCLELFNDFDDLCFEAKTLMLSPNQKKLVRYLIDEFSDSFKDLHHTAKKETIILAFMFYVKKIENSKIKLQHYRICTKYGLTDQVFEIIVCRLLEDFMKRVPIVPRQYPIDEHDTLVREGRR